ncbi:MAG: hypothetical protein E2P02_16450 [Acidobacteria bacterium]|nr:MAG: hypothetical protein E2P02_16450 [Acidobacteriota bacterium]
MASDEGLPKAEAVAEFLTMRLGRPVAATKIGAVVLPHPGGVVALYEGRQEPIGAICALDFDMAVRLGASLSRRPVLMAEEGDAEGQLPVALFEKVEEVCNGLTAVLTSSQGKLSLAEVYAIPVPIPPEIEPNLSRPARRLDLVVDVDGYGRGTRSFLYGVLEKETRADESPKGEPAELEDTLLSIDMDF